MATPSVLQLPCQVYCSHFSSNRAQQLVGFGGKDGAAYIYPFEGYSRTARLEGDNSPLTALAFDPRQHSVVGGSDKGSIRLWDIGTERFIRTFGAGHKSTVTGVDYHCYTDFIATCSRDKCLRIWDTRKKTCLQSYKGASAPLCATQFSPNGRWAASGCADGNIRLYDLVSGKQLNEFRAHKGAVTSIHFHPEQYYMAVGSSDGSVSLWEAENFTRVFQSEPLDTPVDAVQLFGKKMIVAAFHTLRVYDFKMMSDAMANAIESPWDIIGDLTYSSVSDEAWFVEFNGATATMGRLPIGSSQENASPLLNSVNLPRKDLPPTKSFIFEDNMEKLSSSSSMTTIFKPQPHEQQQQQLHHQNKNSNDNNKIQPKKQSEKILSTGVDTKSESSKTVADVPQSSPVEDLLASNASTLSILRRRLTHIRVIRSLWARDIPQALEYLKRLCIDKSDYGVVMDFLVSMQHMRMKERVSINTLPNLLDVLSYALRDEHESVQLSAVKVFRSMNNKFRAKMGEVRRFLTSFRAVDAETPEAMMRQYNELSQKFEEVAILVHSLQKRRGSLGDEVRETLSELPTFSQVK